MSGFADLVRRDLQLAVRVGGGALLAAVFFLSIVVILPFAIGPDLPLLAKLSGPILWVGALLAMLLGLDRIFQADYDDGSLDLLLKGEAPLESVVIAKFIAHWLVTGVPLICMTPLLGLMLNIPLQSLAGLMLTLAIGTPALTCLGGIGAALTVSLARGGLLLPIIVLPLSIPVLIFGVSATTVSMDGLIAAQAPLLYLAGISLFFMALGPIAASFALRQRG